MKKSSVKSFHLLFKNMLTLTCTAFFSQRLILRNKGRALIILLNTHRNNIWYK